MYDRVSQRLIDVLTQRLEKKFGIERLKELGVIEFNGAVDLEEAEK